MPATVTDRLSGITTSVAVKPPCVAVTSANITLAGLQTIGGVVLAEGDRVLVRAQTSSVDNGIYNASTGSWTRAKDFDGNRDVTQGTLVLVRTGSVDGAIYEQTTASPVIGTSAIVFELRDDPAVTYPQTDAEISAGVTPVNYAYAPGDPFRFGAAGDDATNDWAAFDKAFRSSMVVRIPNFDYLVQGDPIAIRDGQTIIFEGGQIRHTDVAGTIFEAIEKSDFAILGKIILKGTLTVAATNDEVGLYIEKCKRYRVEGVEARLFTGIGIHLSGDTTIPGNFRGERGQFTDCAAYENTVGLQIDVGAASEYNTWTNFQVAGNVRAIDVAAGNNTFIGGNVVDNTEGVYVRNGSNHAHGIFSGVNINHNTSFNIKCEGVTNGQTFVGCHVYGDSAFAGYIWFVNSKGCQVINGTIDAPIQCDGTTGLNFITGNFIAGATNPVISGTDPEKLILRTNYTGTAPWGLDDPADVYVQATRGTSTQSLTTGNTEVVVFNNEEEDNRSAFDPTTGIFTAPYTGRYQFICTMYLTGASGMSATFMEFYKNNTTTINFGSLVYNATNVLGTMTLDINMDAGDTMRVRVTSNGVTPVVAVDKTRFMATMLH